jgi:hypothetical protein
MDLWSWRNLVASVPVLGQVVNKSVEGIQGIRQYGELHLPGDSLCLFHLFHGNGAASMQDLSKNCMVLLEQT